jgi:hypothetical protein
MADHHHVSRRFSRSIFGLLPRVRLCPQRSVSV